MDIIIQTNNSDDRAVRKELTTLLTLEGSLREQSSIIDPVITIEADISVLTGCNYITIPAWGRSYFVQNITSVRTGLVQLSAHVDVLVSFATPLLQCVAVLNRQENIYDLYMDDGQWYISALKKRKIINFPNAFTNSGEIILTMIGGV